MNNLLRDEASIVRQDDSRNYLENAERCLDKLSTKRVLSVSDWKGLVRRRSTVAKRSLGPKDFLGESTGRRQRQKKLSYPELVSGTQRTVANIMQTLLVGC